MKNNVFAIGLVVFLSSIEPAHCREVTASGYLKSRVSNINENSDKVVDSLIDYDTLAKEALAAAWDPLPQDKRTEFRDLLRRLLRRSIAKHLKTINTASVAWSGEEPCHTQVIVHTLMIDSKGTTPIDYVMKAVEVGSYRLNDIVVDGSSLVSNYRSSFRKIIEKKGVDGLMQKMRARLTAE